VSNLLRCGEFVYRLCLEEKKQQQQVEPSNVDLLLLSLFRLKEERTPPRVGEQMIGLGFQFEDALDGRMG
jgi:hypothetical protein